MKELSMATVSELTSLTIAISEDRKVEAMSQMIK